MSPAFTTEELINHIIKIFESTNELKMTLSYLEDKEYPGTTKIEYIAALYQMVKIGIISLESNGNGMPTIIELRDDLNSARKKWLIQTSSFKTLKSEYDDLIKYFNRPFVYLISLILVLIPCSFMLSKYIGEQDAWIVTKDLVYVYIIIQIVRFLKIQTVKIRFYKSIQKVVKSIGFSNDYVKILTDLIF